MIDLPRSSLGFVWLVGAGPGAIDLITVRGLNLLREADAVVCDDLVNRELLQHCRSSVELHFAGKRAGCRGATQAEINALLVALGSAGKKTVRLKGGDPLIFGRAGEELQALREAKPEALAVLHGIGEVTATCTSSGAEGGAGASDQRAPPSTPRRRANARSTATRVLSSRRTHAPKGSARTRSAVTRQAPRRAPRGAGPGRRRRLHRVPARR
jgi:siroheme synthase